jgi:hypothetical protein
MHSITFSKEIDLHDYLTGNWVYCTHNGEKWDPANTEQPKIYKRLKLKDGGLEITRFAHEQNEQGLRPRIEIVPVSARLQKQKVQHIRYVVKLEEFEAFRGMIFQIMDHGPNNTGTCPVFQIEIRHGQVHARWSTIKNGKALSAHIHPVANAERRIYNFDIECFLTHEANGYVKLKLDGREVFHKTYITGSTCTLPPQVQYGIYAVAGMQLRTIVKHISWGADQTELPAMEKEPYVILAMGQSNMIAGSSRDPDFKRVRSDYQSRVQWYDLDKNALSRDATMRFATTKSSGSLAKFCADELLKTEDAVLILPTAQSGTPIHQWKKGSKLFNNSVRACKKRKVDLVIWHQGETDRRFPKGYADKLIQLFSDLDGSVPGIDESTRFVVGEISRHVLNAAELNGEIQDAARRHPNCGVVESADFPTNPDKLHFSPDSIERMGRLYAREAGPPSPPSEESMDSADEASDRGEDVVLEADDVAVLHIGKYKIKMQISHS